MASNLIKICTAALAGSLIGIAYERMPPRTTWSDPLNIVSSASSLIPNKLNNRNTRSIDDAYKEYKIPDTEPVSSAENFKHSAKYGLPSKDNLRLFNDYILSYDRRLRAPAWVIEHLTPEKLKHNSDATRDRSKFTEDPAIHEYFTSKNRDFHGSGFDRGHMAAAGNHKMNQDALDQTFVLSNITPQTPALNRGIWERLERYVRFRANRSKNLWVVSGPLYLPLKARDSNLYVTYRVLGDNHVSVPTHYFKVFLVETRDDQLVMEAFLMPNDPQVDGKIDDFRVPINRLDTIERASGVILFDQVPRNKVNQPLAIDSHFKDAPYEKQTRKLASPA